MTAQIPDRIIVYGEAMPLCTTPLCAYFDLVGNKPALEPVSSALWRAYIATWEILGERLYLVGIEATFRAGRYAMLDDFFPGFPERVFAHWYSGVLRIPQGALLQYAHAGFASQTERDLLIDVEAGMVIGRTTRVNGIADTEATVSSSADAFSAIRNHPERPMR
jgi:hypothetical protein